MTFPSVLWRLVLITVFGAILHLFDPWLRRTIRSRRFELLVKYGIGSTGVVIPFVFQLENLLDIMGLDRRQKLIIITTAVNAYITALTPMGIGVIIAHILDQDLSKRRR